MTTDHLSSLRLRDTGGRLTYRFLSKVTQPREQPVLDHCHWSQQ